MKEFLSKLRSRNFVFLGTIIITIVISQLVIHYDLDRQNEDANLINLSGRQRMLSQRITKLTFYIENDYEKLGKVQQFRLDTLDVLITHWKNVHYSLLNGNDSLNLSGNISAELNSLLTENSPRVDSIYYACSKIIAQPDEETIRTSTEVVSRFELPFLQTMEQTVTAFQREAEVKLESIKRIETILGAIAIGVIILNFFYIILPAIRKLEDTNAEQAALNNELNAVNEELLSSEEELRSNLDQISALQRHLETREKQYRDLVEGSSDMIYEINDNGFFSYVNPVMENITEYTAKQLLQKRYWEVITPEFKQQIIQFYKEQRKNKDDYSYCEFTILTASGKEVWIGQSARMIFEEEWITRVNVVARDITKIKEAEKELSRERILLRTIIDNIPLNIYAKNRNSEKILVNRSEFEYLGAKSEEEILGKSDFDLYPLESAKTSVEEDQRVINGKPILNLETFNFRSDGSSRWFLVSKVPLKNEAGNIIGLVGISIDITDRKEAQEKLTKSEKLYRLVSENSQDVISLHKLDGTFEYISPSCRDLHGYEPEELVGKIGTEFMHPDDVKELEKNIPHIQEKMKRNEMIDPIQFRILSKHRGIVWVENLMRPTFEDGVLTGFQSTVRDISQRKEYENALLEAKEKAEDATKAKAQFLSVMSHEIRTPLNAILGMTNILIDENPRADQTENLKVLKFSAENLLIIINDILDFSKIEAGKIEFENVNFNLRDLINNLEKTFAFRIKEKNISLEIHFDANTPEILTGDPVRLSQIINNLLSNAIKFTNEGSVVLAIRATEITEKSATITFSVKDTGIGISKDQSNKIFESFTQASSDTTRKFGGTGLGLSITKKLIDLMEGHIEVESEIGKGSEFICTLTLLLGSEDYQNILIKSYEDDTPSLNNIKILLVEDNAVNQLVAKKYLEKWGAIISIANNGNEAIDKIVDKSFDLVLMDLQMPEMDGYEATKVIRNMKDSYFTEVPILALTADAMTESRSEVIAVGMNDFISKPFQPEEFYQKILSALKPGLVHTGPKSKIGESLKKYTEGDENFKRELIGHLIQNIEELKQKFETALKENDLPLLRSAHHKVKTTIDILNEPTLREKLSNAQKYLENKEAISIEDLIRDFIETCDSVISSLQKEKS